MVRRGHIKHVYRISGSISQKRRGRWTLKEFGVLCLDQPVGVNSNILVIGDRGVYWLAGAARTTQISSRYNYCRFPQHGGEANCSRRSREPARPPGLLLSFNMLFKVRTVSQYKYIGSTVFSILSVYLHVQYVLRQYSALSSKGCHN